MKHFFFRLCRIIVVLVLVCSGIWAASPTIQQRVLIAGLASGITQFQNAAAKQLYDYPTQENALALIAFVNLQAMSDARLRGLKFEIRRVEALIKDDSLSIELRNENEIKLQELKSALDDEEELFRREYPRRNKLANSGLKSLCRLCGYSFGTAFKQEKNGFSWGEVDKRDWGRVLGEINAWAAKTFGQDLIKGLMEKAAAG